MNKKIAIFTMILSCAFPFIVSAAYVPDTGQTKCYQAVSPYDEIACQGTGQDGAYSIYTMSFTDNGNGTVTDNNTGLIWQKEYDNNTRNWYQASGIYDSTNNPSSQNVCGSLSLGGHTDWRLPSKKELVSLVDYSVPDPGPMINQTYFPNTSARYFWSATEYAPNPTNAWTVDFNYGSVGYNNKESNDVVAVKCVRDGQEVTTNLIDNGNDTVTDNRTGLMWLKVASGKMILGASLSYCEDLTLGGHTDWRLPNVKELESWIDSTRYNPAISTSYFPYAIPDIYWTSTTRTRAEGIMHDDAWGIDVWDGSMAYYNKAFIAGHYVQCVRNVQSVLNGDINRDGHVNVLDVLISLRIAVGLIMPTQYYLDQGDVAPLVGGVPAPDGNISVADALLILQKAVELVNW